MDPGSSVEGSDPLKGSINIRLVRISKITYEIMNFLVFSIGGSKGSQGHAPPLGSKFSGGSKGDARDARPPGGSNSFNFMQFLGKFGKIVCWRPPWGVGAPSSGKSGIRH